MEATLQGRKKKNLYVNLFAEPQTSKYSTRFFVFVGAIIVTWIYVIMLVVCLYQPWHNQILSMAKS